MIHIIEWSEVKVIQSCLTLCDPMDYTVHGILQAIILEWATIPFSGGSSQPRDRTQVSHFADGFFTVWATREAQEYWSGSLSLLEQIFPNESNQGIAGGFFTSWATREAQLSSKYRLKQHEEYHFMYKISIKCQSQKFSVIIYLVPSLSASLIAQLVKNPSAMQKIPVWFLGQEDSMEKG